MSDLSVKYMGLDLRNPVVISSSGLTSRIEKVREFDAAGAGAIVVKSLFEEQIINEAQFLADQSLDYPESADYLHHYMRQNSVNSYLELLKNIKNAVSVPVIASINCYSSGEWVNFARDIEQTGIDGIELNIYSLPLNVNKSSLELESSYFDAVSKVVKTVNIPVAVKIGDTYTNLPGMVSGFASAGAKGVVLFNRFFSPDIDIKNMKIISAQAYSSGSEYVNSLRWIGIISSLVPTVDLCANTGVHNGTTLIKQLLAGASAVQMCSAVYMHGAGIITDCLQDLSLFMDTQKFRNIDEFKGRLNYADFGHPEKYERVQFMKNFGSR